MILVIIVFTLFADNLVNSKGKTDSSSMALVPYSPPTFGDFHKKERSFLFADKNVTIYQDWEDGGVAAVVWDAAIVLSRYLEQNQASVHSKRVIELGTGTGLVGMVASVLGAKVIVTDRKIALDCTKLNIERNLKEGLSINSLKVAELIWGQDVAHFSPPFDVILGADIVYIEDTFQDLLKTLTDLSNSQTLVLLSCRIRYERDTNFLKLVGQEFNINKVLYDKDLDIVVYNAKRRDNRENDKEL